MAALRKLSLLLVTALLVAGGLACRKPAPAALAPAPAKVDTSLQDRAKADQEARQRAEAEQKRKAEEALEAARKAAAAKAEEYRKAAEVALKDLHFAFDQSSIQDQDKPLLAALADFMKAYPQAALSIEGNCDERGTVEYNLALGERRGHAAMDYLVGLGVAPSRLNTLTYGKEKPVCVEATESCWYRNRRVHFTLR